MIVCRVGSQTSVTTMLIIFVNENIDTFTGETFHEPIIK